MLHELKSVNQKDDGFRRVFIGDYFDLFLWYDQKGGNLIGFELCYNKKNDEHSLIWREPDNYMHSRVDTGESSPVRRKRTPVLIADGKFNNDFIAEKFKSCSSNIENVLAQFIYDKLVNYRLVRN